MSGAVTLEDLSSGQGRIGDSFGLAAWAAVIGVLLAWWLIKSDVTVDQQELDTTYVLSTPLTQVNQSGQSLTERGDTAFAAGDIVTPPGDNALYYFREALIVDSDDAVARQGMAQVLEYLLNEAESAIYHSDFDQARENAAKVLSIDPDNEHALDVNLRGARLKRVEGLLNRAVALYAQGTLTGAGEDNAAALYQQVLELDPGNDAARQGLESVAQRVVANAESAMFAGNVEQGRAYLRQAKSIDADAPGIDTLEQTERNLRELKQSQAVKEQLLAAAEALQANRLAPPAEPNAFALYRKVLEVEPDSAAAQRGLQLVREGLLERARTLLGADDMTATFAQLDAAEQAGASTAEVSALRARAAYRQRLLDAQAGRFDSLTPLSSLTAIRQPAPSYPRNAPRGASGAVEMQMTVTETGDVRDIEVLGSPRDYFERAAVQAVRSWRFEPMMEGGQPIPVRVAVRVAFEG
ncbi:MAG: TonB family protein [Pseudomonadales bacterium]